MKQSILFSLSIVLLYSCTKPENKTGMTGEELINRSIQYHDPQGTWPVLKATFILTDSLPFLRTSRNYSFSIDNLASAMRYETAGTNYEVINDSVSIHEG